MTEEEIKALEEDIEWDARYLDILDFDYESRMRDVKG